MKFTGDRRLMDRLAELRERRALTLRELSEMSGVAADTINQIELGHRKARPSTLRKLARALDVEVRELFEEPALSGKGKAPETGHADKEEGGTREEQRSSLSGLYRRDYSWPPPTKTAETVEEIFGRGYPPPTVEETLEAVFGRWEKLVNRYVDRWTEKLKAGDFTLGSIDECWATLEDLLLELSELNRLEQGAMGLWPDAHDLRATRTGRAIYRIDGLFRPLHDAVRSKFGDDRLEKQRQKHAAPEAFVKDIVRRTG